MSNSKCPKCFSFFNSSDARKIYCGRRCKENSHKQRRRLIIKESGVRARLFPITRGAEKNDLEKDSR